MEPFLAISLRLCNIYYELEALYNAIYITLKSLSRKEFINPSTTAALHPALEQRNNDNQTTLHCIVKSNHVKIHWNLIAAEL